MSIVGRPRRRGRPPRARPGRLLLHEARGEADAGPAADAGQHADILLAVVHPGVDVADDARRGLEPVELATVAGVDRLQVALERAVEHDVARGGQGPDQTENGSGFDQTILPSLASQAMKLPRCVPPGAGYMATVAPT